MLVRFGWVQIFHRHIQRRGSGPGVQPDKRVCIPRGKRQPKCRPVHRGRPARTQRVVQLPEVHPRTVRPTVRSPRAQNPDAKSRGTRDNAVRLCHVEPARVPLRHAAPSPPQVLDSLHWLAKAQSCRPPDFLSGHACQDGKREHRGDFTQEADLVCGICGAHGGYETAEVRDVRRNGGGGRAVSGARKKSGWDVSWTISELSASTPTSGRLQSSTRGNGAEQQNKGRNISWRNRSLQRKPSLGCGMQ